MKLANRLCACALSLCLALAASACGASSDTSGGGSSGPQDANVPMGRYVETNLTMPDDINTNLNIMTSTNADGSIDLYGFTQGDSAVSTRWHSADGSSWQRADDPWMKQLPVPGYFRNAAEAPDGTRFFLYEDEPGALHLYRVKDGSAEEITVPSWREEAPADGSLAAAGGAVTISEGKGAAVREEDGTGDADSDANAAGEGGYGVPRLNPRGLAVLSNGDLLIGFMSGGAVRYTQEGEELRKYPVPFLLHMTVAGGRLYCYTFDGDKLLCFDLETGAEEDALSLENTAASNPNCLFSDREGNVYTANSGGIHRIVPGGVIWETVLDGKLSSINAPSIDLSDVLSDGSGGFYLYAYSQAGGYRLTHAVYDEATPSVPSRELSVYSLRQNYTVQQAIATFQANNPDVMVNYQIGLGSDTSATVEDVIRSLNQELLAGKGPDVLILDGLPVDSYIEKGVLADLSGLAASLEGTYFEQVLNTFRRGDSLPAIPGRFSVPMLFGRDGAGDAIQSLADIAAGGDNLIALNPDTKQFLTLLSAESYPAWIGADGALDSEKLALFLTDAKAVYDRYHRRDDQMTAYTISASTLGSVRIEFSEDYAEFQEDKTKLLMADVAGLTYFNMVCEPWNASEAQVQVRLLPGQAQGCYLPGAIAGVNAAGKQQEEAMGFVKTLLSTEVQFLSFNDGFGVSKTALEQEMARYRERLKEIGYEVVDFAEYLYPLLSQIKTPVVADQTLLDAVIGEGMKVLDGSETVEEAVQAVQKKMEIRLAE